MPSVIMLRAFRIRSSSLAGLKQPGLREGEDMPNEMPSFSKSDLFSSTDFVVILAHSATNSLQGLKGGGDGEADASGEITTEVGTIVDKR